MQINYIGAPCPNILVTLLLEVKQTLFTKCSIIFEINKLIIVLTKVIWLCMVCNINLRVKQYYYLWSCIMV